jgi:hypothetical protein
MKCWPEFPSGQSFHKGVMSNNSGTPSKMECKMNGMKIDLRTIKVWVSKWEKNNGKGKTASQLAAVMLCKVLEENEKRIVRVENLMREIIRESGILRKMERSLLPPSRPRRVKEPGLESELKVQRQRMAAILKEADEEMKVPAVGNSILVGGLLLEIDKQGWAEGTSHELR